jgi:hypothetical protein
MLDGQFLFANATSSPLGRFGCDLKRGAENPIVGRLASQNGLVKIVIVGKSDSWRSPKTGVIRELLECG